MSDLEGGAILDRNRLEIDLWFHSTMDEERVERLRHRWPGWTILRHDEGLPGHLARTGRDPSLARIGETAALEEIERVLLQVQDFNPARLLERLESQGQKIESIASGFLKTDVPVGDSSTIRSMFERTLSEYQKASLRNRIDDFEE